jgi:heparanase 1
LSGNGIGARVEAAQYAKDVINLKKIMKELYKTTNYNSRLVAPGGFYSQDWYTKLLQDSGPGIVDVVTHHIYNLGGGMQPWLQISHLCQKFKPIKNKKKKFII